MKLKTKNWSCGLEHGDYEHDQKLVIQEAIEAVEETAPGYYVNLVTPGSFGNPDMYLTPILKKNFADKLFIKFIDQCGCGGYVLRVTVKLSES